MIIETSLRSARLELRSLSSLDVTQDYVDWLNDPDTNRYLEVRFSKQTTETVKEFVQAMADSSKDYLAGILLRAENRHIGNIRIGPVDRHNKNAAIGLMIGSKDFRGQGIGSEAISLISDFCFDQLGLSKIWAGCYQSNQESQRAFIKSGFQTEAILKDHCIYSGSREDVVILSKFRLGTT